MYFMWCSASKVLFEEVLSRLHETHEPQEVQSPESLTSETSFVQDAFDNSKPLGV